MSGKESPPGPYPQNPQHPCTPDIPDWYSIQTQQGSEASLGRSSGPVCNTPATVETGLGSSQSLGRLCESAGRDTESVDSTEYKEMFCMNSQIWLDSSHDNTEDTATRNKSEENAETCDNFSTSRSQSLSSYKLLQDVHKAKEKSERKQTMSCMKHLKPKQMKKFSKSKFLSVNGWNVEEERQSLLQTFEDCVYMDESKYILWA